jgi:hypothetical protein
VRSPKQIIPYNPLKENFLLDANPVNDFDINASISPGNDSVSKINNPSCKEQPVYAIQALDLINEDIENQYGVRIWYWGRKLDILMDNYYGEPQDVTFEGPKEMTAMVNPTVGNPLYLPFGKFTDIDMTITISFHQWNKVWGTTRPPTEGDRFLIKDENCTRPELQSPRIFTVLTKNDLGETGYVGPYNSVYRWTITAKLSTNSYEKNAPEQDADLGSLLNVDAFINADFESDQSATFKNAVDVDKILYKNNPASRKKTFKRK